MNPQDEPPVTDASVLEKVRVPLAGDLLGRERVTAAKKTPLGCDSAVERFENIVGCPALWHAKVLKRFLWLSHLATRFT